MYNGILDMIANALCSYGIWAAGLFSAHNTYEEKIPSALVSPKEAEE